MSMARPFSRISQLLGGPPLTCPNCGNRGGTWTKSPGSNHPWECQDCGHEAWTPWQRKRRLRDE